MYDYGGFRLPFLVTGIASGILIVGLVFILPENDVQEDESEEPVHMTDVLKIPSVTILLFVVISCLLTTGFLDATLETHLASYNLSPSIVGAVISLLGLSYSIVAPLVAWLLGRYGAMFCFVFGGACTLIGLLLLAPMPYLSIPPSLFFQVVGVLLVGSGTSFLGTPILPCVLKETKHLGEVAREIVVGTAICAYSIGDILGPVVGTALLDHFSFQIASLVVAGIIGSFTLLQIFTMLYKNQSYRNEVVEEGEEETSFRQPLLIEEDSSILQKPIQS
jgi:predicted MFS family arabinose efflux permease